MKKISIVVTGLLILSACNNKSKQSAQGEQKSEKKVDAKEVQHTPANKVTSADYDTLFVAAYENQIDIVKEKLKEGANINHADSDGRTALMLAAFNGHTEIVNYLLNEGADCRILDTTKRSALMFACTGPFIETVKLLINAGSEINGKDSHENWTPLMFASGEGQLEIVKLLIASGADISMVDIDGESSYDFALSKGHTATAQYLKSVAQNQK